MEAKRYHAHRVREGNGRAQGKSGCLAEESGKGGIDRGMIDRGMGEVTGTLLREDGGWGRMLQRDLCAISDWKKTRIIMFFESYLVLIDIRAGQWVSG